MVSERNRWRRAMLSAMLGTWALPAAHRDLRQPGGWRRLGTRGHPSSKPWCILLLASSLACSMSACGNGLKYTVDDALIEPIPAREKPGVLEARREAIAAEAERTNTDSGLQAVSREIEAAAEEKTRARLASERVVAEQEGAAASRDENQANLAAHHKALADLAVNAAEAKVDWLHHKRDWLARLRVAAGARVEAARARVELEEARVAQAWGLKSGGGFRIADYEQQWQGLAASWEERRRAAEEEGRQAAAQEARWRDQEALVQRRQGAANR